LYSAGGKGAREGVNNKQGKTRKLDRVSQKQPKRNEWGTKVKLGKKGQKK